LKGINQKSKSESVKAYKQGQGQIKFEVLSDREGRPCELQFAVDSLFNRLK
jgi:hypothetical protein